MKSTPILFSATMVGAIRAGRKTQTRRIVKPPSRWPQYSHPDPFAMPPAVWWWNGEHSRVGVHQECPYGQPGAQLWVKETFQVLRETCSYEIGEYDVFEWESDLYGDPQTQLLKDCPRGGHRAVIAYRADFEESFEGPWRPSIFMPRWASRLTLEVTGVRVERLRNISPEDAIAEGIRVEKGSGPIEGQDCYMMTTNSGYMRGRAGAIVAYRDLWESINGRGSWDENPFVWVVEFKQITTTHNHSNP